MSSDTLVHTPRGRGSVQGVRVLEAFSFKLAFHALR